MRVHEGCYCAECDKPVSDVVTIVSVPPPTPNGVVSDELREEIEGYFKALGMADAFDYERFLKEYVDAIMLIITQQTTAARIDELEHTQHDFTHGESSAAFDDGRTYEQLLNKQRLTELKKGLK